MLFGAVLPFEFPVAPRGLCTNTFALIALADVVSSDSIVSTIEFHAEHIGHLKNYS